MDVATLLAESDVRVRNGTYAVVKSKRPDSEAFATINDGAETTVIVESDEYDPDDAIEVEDGWRLLTFDVVLPFELVGFLARVASALGDAGVSIFAVSAYSTDHILVAEDDLETAIECLESLGCSIDIEEGR